MAEPVIHHYPTHPCRQCSGERTVMEKAWSDPRCWVACMQCGNSAGANTIQEALTAWNDANPEAKEPARGRAV
jgi:5-methylcytosine-specific restriction endonuclease McrA